MQKSKTARALIFTNYLGLDFDAAAYLRKRALILTIKTDKVCHPPFFTRQGLTAHPSRHLPLQVDAPYVSSPQSLIPEDLPPSVNNDLSRATNHFFSSFTCTTSRSP